MKKVVITIITFLLIFPISLLAQEEPTVQDFQKATKLYSKAHELYKLAESQFNEAQDFEQKYYKSDEIEHLRQATILYNLAATNFERAEEFFIEADKLMGIYTDKQQIAKKILDMRKQYIKDENRELVNLLPQIKVEVANMKETGYIDKDKLAQKIEELLNDGNQVLDQGEQLFQLGEDIMANSPTATITDYQNAKDYYLSSIDFFLGAYDYYSLVEELLKLIDKEPQPVFPQAYARIKVIEVHFDVDKYNVKALYLTKILRMAKILQNPEFPEYELYIEGHTDSDYTEEYNQRLSERRAASVLDKLHDFGIPLDLMHTSGFGELQPIASNQTTQGKAQNRRTEIILVIKEEDQQTADQFLENIFQ